MSVVVGQGTAGISTGTYPTNFRYWIANTTTTGSPAGEVVSISTANASNPRIDTIVAYVNESATFTSTTPNFPGGWTAVAVAGSPAGSPTAPTSSAIQSAIGAGNPYIVLANVLVGTSVTQINSGNITDLRTLAQLNTNVKISTSQITNSGFFSAYKASSSPYASATTVVWDTKISDVGSNYSTATGLYTTPFAGPYHFDVLVTGSANTSGNEIFAQVLKNGSTTNMPYLTDFSAANPTSIAFPSTFDLVLAQGDTVGIVVGSTTFQGGQTRNFFNGYPIGHS